MQYLCFMNILSFFNSNTETLARIHAVDLKFIFSSFKKSNKILKSTFENIILWNFEFFNKFISVVIPWFSDGYNLKKRQYHNENHYRSFEQNRELAKRLNFLVIKILTGMASFFFLISVVLWSTCINTPNTFFLTKQACIYNTNLQKYALTWSLHWFTNHYLK